jgi:hypothetical protein
MCTSLAGTVRGKKSTRVVLRATHEATFEANGAQSETSNMTELSRAIGLNFDDLKFMQPSCTLEELSD